MISVVTFLWHGGRHKYTAEHVNVLFRMVRRNYSSAFRAICVTNYSEGIDSRVEIVPDTEDWATVRPNLDYYHDAPLQSCFRRLRLYHPRAGATFGGRYVCLDLDVVITGDITMLWHRPEDVVYMAGSANARTPYNGSMQLIAAGSRPQVWESFDPETSPDVARAAGYGGTDQAWIAHALGSKEATWCAADGCYKFSLLRRRELPEGARFVNFAGPRKPWELKPDVSWIQTHYR